MKDKGKRSALFYSFIILLLFLPAVTQAQQQKKLVEVVAENAKIHAQPDASSEVIQSAAVSQVYDMLGKVGSWYEIQFTTERLGITMTGYIHERYVKVLGEEKPARPARREPVSKVPGKKDMRILFEAVGSYFQPSDQAFKSIYGGGTYFGAEINITLMRGVSLWAGAHMFSKTGLTTFTQEPTEISITPIYGGLKFRAPSAKVSPYLGLGVGYFQYKETSAIGEVQKGNIGYIGQLGILINVIGPIYLDLKGCYSYCKVQPEELEADLGGFQVIGGFGFGF
jgi:hypothetical protein